jgi:hypothetical protein
VADLIVFLLFVQWSAVFLTWGSAEPGPYRPRHARYTTKVR